MTIQSTTQPKFVSTGATTPTQRMMIAELGRLKGIIQNHITRFPASPDAPKGREIIKLLDDAQRHPKEFGLDDPAGLISFQKTIQTFSQHLSSQKN